MPKQKLLIRRVGQQLRQCPRAQHRGGCPFFCAAATASGVALCVVVFVVLCCTSQCNLLAPSAWPTVPQLCGRVWPPSAAEVRGVDKVEAVIVLPQLLPTVAPFTLSLYLSLSPFLSLSLFLSVCFCSSSPCLNRGHLLFVVNAWCEILSAGLFVLHVAILHHFLAIFAVFFQLLPPSSGRQLPLPPPHPLPLHSCLSNKRFAPAVAHA